MIQASPFEGGLHGRLLSDPETTHFLSDAAQLNAMLMAEGALALAQADAGLVPHEAAEIINREAMRLELDPESLAEETASAGVPVPALVKVLKKALSPEIARWVHFGATSQDIVDTALILNCRDLLALQERRMMTVIALLTELVDEHRHTLVAGRTRTQQAAPMSLGLKISTWLSPLLRQYQRLVELRPRLFQLQLGGAVGSLSAMGDQAEAVAQAMAQRLGLRYGPSWHSQRDSLVELSGWLAMTTGSLGKMAEDWLRMAQTEIGEVHFRNSGGSSTMPQKSNPVNAEIVLATARQNAALAGQMQQTMLHEHERSGTSWTLEWLALPNMFLATGVSLNHSITGLQNLGISAQRIDANLNCNNGLIYAEAVTFALAEFMPRDEASEKVKKACVQATDSHRHLVDVVADMTGQPINMTQLNQNLLNGGATKAWIDTIMSQARALPKAFRSSQ